jgi:hypothetical protein
MILAVGANLIAPLAGSIEAIPETPGWRGFVVVGAGYTDVKSNLVPGNDLIDLGRDTSSINDMQSDNDSPDRQGEVNYRSTTGRYFSERPGRRGDPGWCCPLGPEGSCRRRDTAG